MYLLAGVVERMTRSVYGGIETDESRWDQDFVASKVDSAISYGKIQAYYKLKVVPGEWLIQSEVAKEDLMQDDVCKYSFAIPTVLTLHTGAPVLNVGGRQGKYFKLCSSRSQFLNLITIPYFRKNGIAYISGNICYVYTEMDIDSIKIECCPVSPMDIPTFNPDFDSYGVTDDVLELAEKWLINQFNLMASKPLDEKSNSKDDSGNWKQQMRPGKV